MPTVHHAHVAQQAQHDRILPTATSMLAGLLLAAFSTGEGDWMRLRSRPAHVQGRVHTQLPALPAGLGHSLLNKASHLPGSTRGSICLAWHV